MVSSIPGLYMGHGWGGCEGINNIKMRNVKETEHVTLLTRSKWCNVLVCVCSSHYLSRSNGHDKWFFVYNFDAVRLVDVDGKSCRSPHVCVGFFLCQSCLMKTCDRCALWFFSPSCYGGSCVSNWWPINCRSPHVCFFKLNVVVLSPNHGHRAWSLSLYGNAAEMPCCYRSLPIFTSRIRTKTFPPHMCSTTGNKFETKLVYSETVSSLIS